MTLNSAMSVCCGAAAADVGAPHQRSSRIGIDRPEAVIGKHENSAEDALKLEETYSTFMSEHLPLNTMSCLKTGRNIGWTRLAPTGYQPLTAHFFWIFYEKTW